MNTASYLSEAIAHSFSQLLYRCFEDVGSTKAALYLSMGSADNFYLVAHYGWPRAIQPPEVIPFKSPLMQWAGKERQPLVINPPNRPMELADFMAGADAPRFLLTPIYHQGNWIGLLLQRDRTKSEPFELVHDSALTKPIVEAIVTAVLEYNLHKNQSIIPIPRQVEAVDVEPVAVQVPHSSSMVNTMGEADSALESSPGQVDEETIGGTCPDQEQNAGTPSRLRRGIFMPEQRTFFWETAKLLFSLVPVGAVALWMDEPSEMRPILLCSRNPLPDELKQQVLGTFTFHIADVKQSELRLLHESESLDQGPANTSFMTYLPVLLQEEGGAEDLLLIFRAEDRPFTHQEQVFIQQVARLLGYHLQEMRLHERYHRAFLSVSHRLLVSMEKRSPALRPHSIATAKLARSLARRLDLPTAELEAISIAAILHDVGTLLLEPSLMLKTDLTEDERTKIRSHPLLAATFLKDFRFPFDVMTIIRHHHERWDGKGYPDGLRGDEIPIGSRIINLVEAYEVMTSGRPYKNAMNHDQIFEEFRKEAGRQFDPELVPVFMRLIKSRLKKERAS